MGRILLWRRRVRQKAQNERGHWSGTFNLFFIFIFLILYFPQQHQPRESPDKVKTRSDEDATISTVLQSSAYNSAISSIVVRWQKNYLSTTGEKKQQQVDQVQSLLVADDNVMLNNKIEAVVEVWKSERTKKK